MIWTRNVTLPWVVGAVFRINDEAHVVPDETLGHFDRIRVRLLKVGKETPGGFERKGISFLAWGSSSWVKSVTQRCGINLMAGPMLLKLICASKIMKTSFYSTAVWVSAGLIPTLAFWLKHFCSSLIKLRLIRPCVIWYIRPVSLFYNPLIGNLFLFYYFFFKGEEGSAI